MKQKVQKFVSKCIKCIMNSAPVRATERNLYSISLLPVPFDTIHLDHYGPLPSIKSKRKHVLVVVDAFTKYVKLYPASSTSTREVTAALEKYCYCYSRPRHVISDRGTCFTSAEFSDYLEKKNVVHTKNATASPQANGQVERVNRVLKSMLGKLSEPIDHADWSNRLLAVEYAMNNSKHSTTKETPCKLLFGVEQRGEVIDELTEFLKADRTSDPTQDLTHRRTDARAAIERSQKCNEERALKLNRPAKTYEVGA